MAAWWLPPIRRRSGQWTDRNLELPGAIPKRQPCGYRGTGYGDVGGFWVAMLVNAFASWVL